MGQVFFWNARAIVFHADFNVIINDGRAHSNLAFDRRVFEGVIEQIVHDLFKAEAIDPDKLGLIGDLEDDCHVFTGQGGLPVLGQASQKQTQVEIGVIENIAA